MTDVAATPPVGHRGWWGPRIWRVLHTLAELSVGRTDTTAGWRTVIRTTSAMLPCAMCRNHFGAAMRSVRVPSGVRHGLWAAHAAVGGVLPEAELAAVYGGEGGCDTVAALVAEVGAEFRRANVLDHFRVGYLGEWEHAVSGLIRLLRLPPPTPAPQAGTPRVPSGATPAGLPTSLRGRPIPLGRRRA